MTDSQYGPPSSDPSRRAYLLPDEVEVWDYLHDPLRRDRSEFDDWLLRQHIKHLESLSFAREAMLDMEGAAR